MQQTRTNASKKSFGLSGAPIATRLQKTWRRVLLVCAGAAILLALPDSAAAQGNAAAETGSGSTDRPAAAGANRERAQASAPDAQALQAMARVRVRHGEYADAIGCYRRALALRPHDHDARVGLAHALALDGRYEAALRTFQELLRERPEDTDALEGWARTEMWAGHPLAALPVFQNLARRYPSNPDYAVGLAQVETALQRFPEARETLTALLAAHPHNPDAQLQLAYVDLFQGNQAAALRQFNRLIREDPTNREALKGNVRIAYYRGDLVYAHALAARIVDDDPRDVSALLLLAHLERAMHHRRQAWALLQSAERLAPHNAEARDLEASLLDESRPTLHTSASFAREIGSGSPASTEDLRTFGYESTWGFLALPRSESYLTLDDLPSESPSGGLRGAVAPSQIFYHQTTYLTPSLTLRGGVGLMRFGPGAPASVPTQTQTIDAAGMRAVGFGSASYALEKKLTVDLTAGRSPITYTPTAVRLGVMEVRLAMGLDYRFNAKTSLRLEPFVTDDSTIAYGHVIGLVGSNPAQVKEADHNRAGGATLIFDRRLLQRRSVALNVGYSGFAYAIAGGTQKPYLGFFNPSFYQRQYLTTRVTGTIRGPLGYDFTAAGGVQQVEHGGAVEPAMLISPAFTFKAGSRCTLKLSYTHYDSSQSLGTLRGNAAQITTDWKF